jgi:hypothetical protein
MFIRTEIDEQEAADIPVPAHIAQYVDVLRIATTVRFLLHFGGAPLYLTDDPKGRGELEAVIGTERTRELGRRAHLLPARVPLAKPWIAAVLAASGAGTAEVARRLHVTDITVRRWLA